MPMRTHERRQASGRGLTGSDASGWTLLAFRDEAVRRGAELREHGGRRWWRSDRESGAGKAGHRTEIATQIALAGISVTGAVALRIAGGVDLCRVLVMLAAMVQALHFVVRMCMRMCV